MLKAILFDLDGTLVNSLADLADCANYAVSKLGYPKHDVSEFKQFVGDGIPKMIERALPGYCKNADILNKGINLFLKRYSEHYSDKTSTYDNMPFVIDELIKKNIKIAVVSNKMQEMAEAVVNKFYLDKFNIVAGKRDGYKTKPDAKLTLEIISQLNVNPCECAFVGDSGMDMKTGVNAGAVSIGALWGFRTSQELESNGADYLIQNPIELLEVVKEINNAKL